MTEVGQWMVVNLDGDEVEYVLNEDGEPVEYPELDDILDWWNIHGDKFPGYQIARRVTEWEVHDPT